MRRSRAGKQREVWSSWLLSHSEQNTRFWGKLLGISVRYFARAKGWTLLGLVIQPTGKIDGKSDDPIIASSTTA